MAQSIVNIAVEGVRLEQRPGFQGYDPLRTVTELRREWGEATESTIASIEEYCAKRPALSAWLDTTGAGNSPTALRLLAAMASDKTIVTNEGAKKYVDALGKNEEYWKGDKLELAKARIAFMIADEK